MSDPKHKTTVLLARNVPIAVKSQFKAYCARHDYTMEAAITALMRKAVERDMVLIGAGKARRNTE